LLFNIDCPFNIIQVQSMLNRNKARIDLVALSSYFGEE
jgi:hypothetical protein